MECLQFYHGLEYHLELLRFMSSDLPNQLSRQATRGKKDPPDMYTSERSYTSFTNLMASSDIRCLTTAVYFTMLIRLKTRMRWP